MRTNYPMISVLFVTIASLGSCSAPQPPRAEESLASPRTAFIECDRTEAKRILVVKLRPEKLAEEKREFYLREMPPPMENEGTVYMSSHSGSARDYMTPNGRFGTGCSISLNEVTDRSARLHITFYCIGKGSPGNYELDRTIDIPFGPEQTFVLSGNIKLVARYGAPESGQ
jgi:hypothetical protein